MDAMKPILDACCGGKMFYFDKHDDRVLFQDIRKVNTTLCDGRHFVVDPDIQADFKSMPYPDGSFRMVVFDPPHLKYTGSKKEAENWQMMKYGWLPAHGWEDVLRQGFAECFRVLENGGFLIFKWNETDIKVSEILKLTPQKPVFGHISGKRANTHWICFLKDDKICDTPHYSAASVAPK
ncbi:MAG: class I SAM-dependent methyltransferase [Bacteroidales bacterium]|nr:class I SAM-dependent methyltransferase [Bacteroidales bacterium]